MLTYAFHAQRSVNDWLHLIKLVAEARKFDLSNQLYSELLAILAQASGAEIQKDDADNWEKVHIAWVLALSSTFNDVSVPPLLRRDMQDAATRSVVGLHQAY
jgi:hypothetical protein